MTNFNINFESKAMEQIQVELSKEIFKEVRGHIEESIICAISERWEDIFRAVIEAQPAPNAVSDDAVVAELKDRVAALENKLAKKELVLTDLNAMFNAERDRVIALEAELAELRAGVAVETIVDATEGDLNIVIDDLDLSIDEFVSEAVEAGDDALSAAMTEEQKEVSDWLDKTDEELLMEDGAELSIELNIDVDIDIDMESDELPEDMQDDNIVVLPDGSTREKTDTDRDYEAFISAPPVTDPFAGGVIIDDSALEESTSSDFDLNAALSDLDAQMAALSNELPSLNDAELPESPEVPEVPAHKEEEKPASSLPKMPQGLEVANKYSTKVVTYDVNGVAVPFLRDGARINDLASNGKVRSQALAYNKIMMQMNPKKGYSEDQQAFGRFYTQMIREYALEIAAANGVTEPVKGDSGSAILVAEVAEGMKKQPALTFRNETERAATANVYRDMVANPSKVAEYQEIVNSYLSSLPLTADAFVSSKDVSEKERNMTGIALLYVRLDLTWNRTATKGKRIVNVFSEIKKENA